MSQYSPADPSVTSEGYELDETSDMWKDICKPLPCDLAMAWPLYVTAAIDVVINDEPFVIQCWKGLCEDAISQLPALPDPIGVIEFPGGIGAEVGIYRRQTDVQIPASLIPPIPASWPPQLQAAAHVWFGTRALRFNIPAAISGSQDYWFPADGVGIPVSFTLTEPAFGDDVISNYTTDRYWTCQWMRPTSWPQWLSNWHGRHHGASPIDAFRMAEYSKYVLDFYVAGIHYIWDDASMRVA
jgi:hypothetical protein